MFKKTVCLLVLLLFFSVFSMNLVGAWPDQEITIVVPYGAGGGTDMSIRFVQPTLQDILGVPIVVDNIPGGGSLIGTEEYMLNYPDDGSALLGQIQPYVSTVALRGTHFKVDDVIYLMNIYGSPQALYVRKESKIINMEDLVDVLKAENPTYGTIPASFSDIAPPLLAEVVGGSTRTVPYDSGADIRAAVLGGHVDFAAQTLHATAASLGDDVRFLALFADERDEHYPEIPTVNEELIRLGYEGNIPELSNIYFLAVKRNVMENHPDRFEILVNAVKKAIEDPELAKRMEKAGMHPVLMGPDEVKKAVYDLHEVVQQFKERFVD